ncbi:MAG: hypothetical protein LH702_11635 [Phormidesmis sp. CAN_BIN44]|nr:hypothetical protein [Phormidesmis sp. CAN_BIN44]
MTASLADVQKYLVVGAGLTGNIVDEFSGQAIPFYRDIVIESGQLH